MDNVLKHNDPAALGQELQEARKNRKLTQDDAAKILGVARTTINAIEKGERRIKAGELIKLARAYGCTVSELVQPQSALDPFHVQPHFKDREAQKELGRGPLTAQDEKLPTRYQYLAARALDLGVISEGHFARLLDVVRLEARSIANTLRGLTDDVTELGHLHGEVEEHSEKYEEPVAL